MTPDLTGLYRQKVAGLVDPTNSAVMSMALAQTFSDFGASVPSAPTAKPSLGL